MQCPPHEDTEQADDASCVYSGPLHSPSLLEKYQPEACAISMNTPGPSPHRAWQGPNGFPFDNHQPVLAATLSCPERATRHEPGNDAVEDSSSMSLQGLSYAGNVVKEPVQHLFTVPAPSDMTLPAYSSRESTPGYTKAMQPDTPAQNIASTSPSSIAKRIKKQGGKWIVIPETVSGTSPSSIADRMKEQGGKWVIIPEAVRHRKVVKQQASRKWFVIPEAVRHRSRPAPPGSVSYTLTKDEEHKMKAFAAHYSHTRRDLGFMQHDVSNHLEALFGVRCSKSMISSFERAEMRPQKAKEVQVMLKAWLESHFVKERREQLILNLSGPSTQVDVEDRRLHEEDSKEDLAPLISNMQAVTSERCEGTHGQPSPS